MLLELICSVAFTIEVIFRLAVVDGLWPLITDVCLYIDIIAILPFVFDLVCVATGDFGPLPEFEGEPEPEVVPDNGLAVHTNPFDWLRVARLLRLFKLARHFEGSRVIVDTLKRSFYALLVPLLFLLTGVIIFAGLLTYVEQDGEARDDFGNILKSSWFVLVTFSTVGYEIGRVSDTEGAARALFLSLSLSLNPPHRLPSAGTATSPRGRRGVSS